MTEQVSGVPSQRSSSSDRSTAQLVQDLSNEVSRLVRDEIRLATDELQRKAKRAGVGVVAAVLASTVALLGAAAFKGSPPAPEEAMRGVRADADAVREGARR